MNKALREHLRKLGAKGGRSKSPAKLKALKHARVALAAKRKASR